MSDANLQWILKSRPTGRVTQSNLALESSAIPVPGNEQIVVRTQYLSIDPANRLWMNEDPVYFPPLPLNTPMAGLIMGVVTASKSSSFKVGDRVMGFGTWSEYCKADATLFQLMPDIKGVSPKDVFGYFQSAIPTAYFGVKEICAPKPGETMVVSGAAGAVGSIAVQLGKAYGCRVIGIAGGPEKCALLIKELGVDVAVDYKSSNFGEQLAAACPSGIDCFFDNVAGEVLDQVLPRMNNFGRVAQCGAVAGYNDDPNGPQAGVRNYSQIVYRRLKVQGFIALWDYADRIPEAHEEVARLYREGKIVLRLHEISGIENALNALNTMFSGGNTGKLMIKVSA